MKKFREQTRAILMEINEQIRDCAKDGESEIKALSLCFTLSKWGALKIEELIKEEIKKTNNSTESRKIRAKAMQIIEEEKKKVSGMPIYKS